MNKIIATTQNTLVFRKTEQRPLSDDEIKEILSYLDLKEQSKCREINHSFNRCVNDTGIHQSQYMHELLGYEGIEREALKGLLERKLSFYGEKIENKTITELLYSAVKLSKAKPPYAFGGGSFFVIGKKGELYAWGNNYTGRLGVG